MKTGILLLTVIGLAVQNSVALPHASRIVGGSEAEAHAAPYIVSLQWSSGDDQQQNHFCAAAIVSADWIVTAGHCVSALPLDAKIVVLAGRHNLFVAEEKQEQLRTVTKIVSHEQFKGGISAHDIALLRLDEPLEFTQYVHPIALATSRQIVHGEVTLFGWGSVSTEFEPEFPGKLQTVTTEIIDFEECEEELGGEGATPLESSNLCTGPWSGGISACNGDSGGPLVQTDAKGIPTLVGIVSWGFYPCGTPGSPSIYTSVAAFYDWLDKHIH